MKNKFCTKCQSNKLFSDFGKDSARKDGMIIYCKVCIVKINKIIRKNNNKKRTEYNKKYRKENREKYNNWEKNYYNKNKEKLNMKCQKWRDENGIYITLNAVAKNRAKNKNLVYELNAIIIKEIVENQGNKCALTGISFNFERNNQNRNRPFVPSIDRINNEKGYTTDNIQIVCCIVNKAKNEYQQEIFDEMCEARVRQIHGS